MSVKEHYDNHLGNVYAWMVGDFGSRQAEFERFLESHGIRPAASGKAIDLGAGHGIQSVSLAKQGFTVLAVDFNDQLLEELKPNAQGLAVEIRKDDIRNLRQFVSSECEVITCCGDTLTHLESKAEVRRLLVSIAQSLTKNGKAIFSFRDYSSALTGDKRFILVKSDDDRILSCMLEFAGENVRVSDILYEKRGQGWIQRVSSYNKIRITPDEVIDELTGNGMEIQVNQAIDGMVTIVAMKTA